MQVGAGEEEREAGREMRTGINSYLRLSSKPGVAAAAEGEVAGAMA